MIKEAIGIAATIDEARRIATENLNAPIDADVKVEIVSMPKKKVLGLFGGADAKVKAFYDDGVEEPKKAPEKKQESKKEAPKKENKPAPKKEEVKEKTPEIDLSGIEAKETDATKYLKSILVGMGFEDANFTPIKEYEAKILEVRK